MFRQPVAIRFLRAFENAWRHTAPLNMSAMNPEQVLRRCIRWMFVVLFAIAMAWVESAVVFYLRTMIDRIEPYQSDPLPLIGGFASVELPREAATLVILLAVGCLAGRTWRARIGYTAVAFGVWDIFYYVFLKLMCGWPHSLLDWDILFLLPLPWWGPVLAPVLISLLMIFWGTLATQLECPAATPLSNWRAWLLGFSGMALALYVFMADALHVSARGLKSVRNVLPEKFNWALFGIALTLMAAPALKLCRRLRGRKSRTSMAEKTITCVREQKN